LLPRAVPPPFWALDVHRAGIPGPPGAEQFEKFGVSTVLSG